MSKYEVKLIREDKAAGLSVSAIAAKHGFDISDVIDVLNGAWGDGE